MGQAASIRRSRTPHATFCKSSLTGLAKRGLLAFSRGSRRHDKCTVQLKHTTPRKLSHIDKSIQSPTCHESFLDDDRIQEIIRKFDILMILGIMHRQWDTLSSVTSSTSFCS
uniref:Uncharacterized protein n=1 Tax=Mesocestoides corti TaxID=53468 RepID=A0A5K3FPM1_MESCO